MSFAAYNPPLKMRANTAATCTNCTAAALTGLPAAFVSFQQQQASHPPTENVDSAVFSLLAAMQFSGSIAIFAANAVTTATFTTF